MTTIEASGLLTDEAESGVAVARRRADRSSRYQWEARYVKVLFLLDVLVSLGAAFLAFFLRFGEQVTDYSRMYLIFTLTMPFIWIVAAFLNRAYETRYLFVGTDEYQRVIRGGLAATAAIAIFSYGAGKEIARGYVVIALPVATVGCVLARFAARKVLHHAHERGKHLRRVVVVGYHRAVQELVQQLRRERYHGMEVVGACLPEPITTRDGGRLVVRTQVDVPVFGAFHDVAGAVGKADADTVIVLSCPEFDSTALRRLAWQLERAEVDLVVASALLDIGVDRTSIRVIDGLPMLQVGHARLRGARRVIKGGFDFMMAALGLAVLSPLMLTVAAVIRATSPGPALFRQVRVGKDGREFRIFKFRTMYTDAEARLSELADLNEHDGLLFKIRNDPRVTKIGAVLRRYSIDELPQLLNVLRGEMSLVGPRPPLPSEVALYPLDMRRRLAVKPGLTGLWQVSGRADLPWEEVVRLDLRYVEAWSLTLDLVILLRTVTAVFRSSGAY